MLVTRVADIRPSNEPTSPRKISTSVLSLLLDKTLVMVVNVSGKSRMIPLRAR